MARYFNTCPHCGGNLDPGEKCDCQEERVAKEKNMQNMLMSGKHGQMMFCFTKEERAVEKAVV